MRQEVVELVSAMPRQKLVTLKVDPVVLARLDELEREMKETDREDEDVEQIFRDLYRFFESARSRLRR